MSLSTATRLLAFVLASGSVPAATEAAPHRTWIVSQSPHVSGAEGADFRSIQRAVDAASPGDVVVVRSGRYASFELDKGVTVLGRGNVHVLDAGGPNAAHGSIFIEDLPPGPPAILVDVNAGFVTVRNCAASVLLDKLTVTRKINVTDNVDVRLSRITGSPALAIARSRLEAVASRFVGESGWQPYDPDGGPGVLVEEGSRAHLARSSSYGGAGADAWIYGEEVGDGGDSIVFKGSQPGDTTLILAGGNAAESVGGPGGTDYLVHLFHGCGGHGLDASGQLVLYSQTEFRGGTSAQSSCDGQPIVGLAQRLQPAAPTMIMTGTPEPGQAVSLELRARDGSVPLLMQGTNPVVVDDPVIEIERLVDVREVGVFAPIAQGNQLSFQWRVPGQAQPGDLFLLQMQVVLPSGWIQRTNSVVVVVR